MPRATDNNGVVVSPDARHAYVANTGDDTVTAYSLAPDGTPSPLSAVPTGGNQPTGLAFTPDGDFLLATNRDGTDTAPSVSVFSPAANGTPTLVASSPVGVGIFDPRAVVVSPDGRFVYVTGRRGPTGPPASNADTAIAALTIDANGALHAIAGSPVYLPGEFNAFGASIAPDGSRLFVAQSNLNAIDVLDLDPTTGAPSVVTGSPFATAGDAPIETQVTPDGGSLYVTDVFGKSVEGFTIAPATGASSQIAGTPVTVVGQTFGIGITPDGAHLYDSILSDPGQVEGFAIGSGGGLTPVTGTPFASGGKFPDFFSVATSPTQTPKPQFTANPAPAGKPTRFDARSTTVRGGVATRFDWDFGDGTTLADGGPTPTHAYAADGTFDVSVTVANDCDPAAVFTGDVAAVGNAVYCNGPTTAAANGKVTIDSAVDGKLKAKSPQKLKKNKVYVEVKVKAGEDLTAELSGKFKQGGKKHEIAPKTKTVASGDTREVKLKPASEKARKKLAKALRKGKKPKATVKATLTDNRGNVAKQQTTVKLKRR